MDIRKLQRAIVDGLEDVKAQHIEVFNTEALSPLFERVIVASGTSNRQTRALASSVRETVKARGFPVLSVEGEDNGEWIIVDCGAAVCHIMQPAIREYYRLEEIWGDKPVRMKMAGVSRPAQAAEELPEAMPAAAKRPSPPAKRAPAGAKKAPGAGRQASAAAKKVPAARKAAAKKGASAKRQSGPARQPLAARRGGQPPRRRA
ncbi:MAG: ribosome silencing factor [Burkholderiales bacterium]|nr:ribosome silencing factor [Burkholderiales bacterium]